MTVPPTLPSAHDRSVASATRPRSPGKRTALTRDGGPDVHHNRTPCHRHYVRAGLRRIGNGDVALVGGKNASLGEMYQHLSGVGVRVPGGFAITAEGYRHVLDEADSWPALAAIFDGFDPDDVAELSVRAAKARQIVYDAGLPDDLRQQVLAAYRSLVDRYGDDLRVAVRSSATAEDLPEASFAGQHESYLDIAGEDELLDAVRRCFASIFTDRGVHYRHEHGFDQLKVALSVGVMKMVRSDLASSGVMFTLDTESGFRDAVFLTAAYGLGENVVQGAVDPDEFYVHKPTYEAGFRAVLRRRLGEKAIRMVTAGDVRDPQRAHPGGRSASGSASPTTWSSTSSAPRSRSRTTTASRWTSSGPRTGSTARRTSSRRARRRRRRQPPSTTLQRYVVEAHGDVLVRGRAVGDRVATGPARVIRRQQPAQRVPARRGPGLRDHDPGLGAGDEDGGRRGHRPRRAHLPRGDRRPRARAFPPWSAPTTATATPAGRRRWSPCPAPRARSAGSTRARPRSTVDERRPRRPAAARHQDHGQPRQPGACVPRPSLLPNDGVGLARMEFIISEAIKVHPLALLDPDRVDRPG